MSRADETPGTTSRGVFVAFEGGDGAGKSSQVRLVEQALTAGGHEVVVTRQPGGTALGAELRRLVLHGDHMHARAEALIYAADKAQHVEEVIRPALARGAVVVTDRYTDSSIAYQGAGRDLGVGEIQRLLDWAVDALYPDLTVVVDVPSEVGRARRGEVHDRLEAEGTDFHDRVRQHFLELAAAAPTRYLVVDGTGAVETIHAEVMARVREVLPR